MRRKYQRSPTKSMRKEDQKAIEEMHEEEDKDVLLIQEVQVVAEQMKDEVMPEF